MEYSIKLFLFVFSLIIPFEIFAEADNQTEYNNLVNLIDGINKTCPKSVSSQLFPESDNYHIKVSLKHISLNKPIVKFEFESDNNLTEWENDYYVKLAGTKYGPLHSFLFLNSELSRTIEALNYNVEIIFSWNDKTSSKFLFTNEEIGDIFYSSERKELDEAIKDIQTALPIDCTLLFNKMFLTDAKNTPICMVESIHVRDNMLEYVMSFTGANVDIKYFNNFNLYEFILFNTLLLGEEQKEFNTLISNCGYGIKYTFILNKDGVMSKAVSNKELKLLLEQINEMTDRDMLETFYKTYYQDTKFPVKADENLSLIAIDFNDDYWIETYDLSSDLFDLFNKNENPKELFLTSLCDNNQLLGHFLKIINCGYKVCLINRQTKHNLLLVIETSEIQRKYDEIYPDN